MQWLRKLVRRPGCVIAVITLAVLLMVALPNWREASVRESWEFTGKAMRGAAGLLWQYSERFDQFPPRETSGPVYLAFDARLVEPLVFDALTTFTSSEGAVPWELYSGPPVDPYRSRPAFPNETAATGRGLTHDGPASFSGYPLRYYRTSGAMALLISNGPDEDIDFTPAQLDTRTTDIWSALLPYKYDPTNGTFSTGDRFMVVEPDPRNAAAAGR